MKMMLPFGLQELKWLGVGVLLRVLAYAAISAYPGATEGGRHILDSMVVRNSQSVLMLREEAFRRAHGIDMIGTESAPFILLAEAVFSAASWLRSALPFAAVSDEACFFALSTAANALALLLWADGPARAPRAAPAAWTWLNPAMLLASSLSPLPALELLLLVSVAHAAARRQVWAGLLFGLLVCAHPTYLALAPAACSLWGVGAAPEKKGAVASSLVGWVSGLATLLPVLAVVLPRAPAPALASLGWDSVLRGAGRGLSAVVNPHRAFGGASYEPSLGMIWYIDAQVFAAFRSYVSALVLGQPFLLVLPLWIRFGASQPRVLFDVTATLVLLFKPVLTLCDVSIAIGLLSRHAEVVARMRRLPLVLLGVLTAAALSPLTLQLWLSRGTGNANYLFFQGLALWVFASVGLVEFVKAAGGAA